MSDKKQAPSVDKLEILKSLLEVANTKSNSEELVSLVKQIVTIYKELRAKTEEQQESLQEATDTAIALLQQRVTAIRDGENGKDGRDGRNGKDGRDGRDGKNGRDGAKGEKGDKGEMGDIKDLSPDEVRNSLEILQGDERLDKSAIKGLEEDFTEIRKIASQRVQTPAKSYAIHPKDLTAQCDGENKTFTVGGSHFGIIGVYGTQFPLIYRPLIDYTETRTGFTLTAAVSAPETNQTLICQYLK